VLKLRPANAVLSLVSKLPKQPDFLLRRGRYSPPKRFRFVPMWGCAQMEPGG
jgi:hypothetical protein